MSTASLSLIPDMREPQRETIDAAYDSLEPLLRYAGIVDLTEGMYVPGHISNTRWCYEKAQRHKAEWVLDQIGCRPESRILDIGCGNGPILLRAQQRGARAIGLTLCESQAFYCNSRGLDVFQLHYRDMDSILTPASFDGAVSLGALEHFVHPEQARRDDGDAIYREMFQLVRGVIKDGARFVTTAIHVRKRRQYSPDDFLSSPRAHKRGSEGYHVASVFRALGGGWYPYPSQLERCAEGYFRLADKIDGTDDYHVTSLFWMKATRHALLNPATVVAVARQLWRHSETARYQVRFVLGDNSWLWQFKPPAPTILLRHVWEAV